MSVYTMQPQTYMYAMPQATAPRQYSTHGTSSAFSSSALPDEDWTKISDLAERRRIQNRIAQRNYRKKLKRRLEDLERRAGSSDEAEVDKPQTQTQTASISSTTRSTSPTNKVTKRSSTSKSPKATKAASVPIPIKPLTQQYTPPLEASDKFVMGRSFDGTERGPSPPMFSPYGTYPAPDDLLLQPYAAAQPYPSITTSDPYPSYLSSGSMSSNMSSVPHFTDPFKRESYSSASDDGMGNFFSHYNFTSPMDMNNYCTSPTNAGPNTPPMSHSYGQSSTCSETGFEYPTTPLSLPDSPGIGGQLC